MLYRSTENILGCLSICFRFEPGFEIRPKLQNEFTPCLTDLSDLCLFSKDSKYAKKLEAAGVSRKQAEAHVQMISRVVEVDMATKQDLKELEYKLTIKLSAIMTTLLSMAVAVIKLL